MRTAIAFTGGVDSTFLLWKVLTETDDEVRAFRLDYRDDPRFVFPPCPAEAIAAQRCADWLAANVRPFEYLPVEGVKFRPGEWSSLACVRTGAAWVRDGLHDRLLVGRNAEAGRNPGLPTMVAQERIFSETTTVGVLKFPLLELGYGKAHAHVMTPPDLFALTLWCKRPRVEDGEIIACGECKTGCRFNAFVADLVAQGYDPAEVVDYGNRVRRRGSYFGLEGGDPALMVFGFGSQVEFPEMDG